MTTVNERLTQELKHRFGFDKFRPGQLEALLALTNQEDTLAVLPTGAGKSLIYELFGYLTKKTVVIVSPLLSLMQDQVRTMNLRGESAVVAVTSMMSYEEKQTVLAHLERYRFIFTSPEMLSQPSFLKPLKSRSIGLLVIDEAHCISTWGPDFRPEYLLLGKIREALGTPLTLMTTATATKRVKEDIKAKMHLPNASEIGLSINRPNIFLAVEEVENDAEKLASLTRLVKRIKKPGIVYFSSKKKADEVAEQLQQAGVSQVAAYHGGLSNDSRYKVQQQFMAGQLAVICATSAFGMGIDKSDIAFVIHYHLPVDLENYWQEVGRAGRNGQQSIAILLYQPGDEALPEFLGQANLVSETDIVAFYQHPRTVRDDDDPSQLVAFYHRHDVPVEQVVKLFATRQKQRVAALEKLVAFVQTKDCRRTFILDYFDEPQTSKTVPCCDLDTDGDVIEELGLLDQGTASKTRKIPAWQTTLDRLF